MRSTLLAFLALVLVVLTGVALYLTQGAPVEHTAQSAPAAPAIGGGFTLTDQNGRTVKDTDLRGTLLLVFFGYTHCPDICPTTLLTLTNLLHHLGADAQKVQVVFITVDPTRDTPARMKEYLANFDPSILGLTGTQEALNRVADAYKVYHSVPEETHQHHEGHDEGAEDAIAHSGFIYLMGRDGAYITHFSSDTPEQQMFDTLSAQFR